MCKFVIWGWGIRGKEVFDLLGEEKIVAIIERDEQLVGTEYFGKPIISFQMYKDEYWCYPVFVTPKGHEDEICTVLQGEGIYWAYKYGEEFYSIESIFRQTEEHALISYFEEKKIYAIWGYSLIAILLYSFLKERGIVCKLIKEKDNELSAFFESELEIELVGKQECVEEQYPIILTRPLGEYETLFFRKNKIESFFGWHEQTERFYNPLIERYKGIHSGRRCFIVATGPSLRMDDLDTLYQKQEICISVNGIFPAFPKTKWRPDYYIVSDHKATKMWKQEIISADIPVKFISDSAWCYADNEKQDNMIKWHMITRHKVAEMPEFSEDFARASFHGYTVTYDGALQLAVYMGFSEIYLLGVDCSREDSVQTRHFTSDYYARDNLRRQYKLETDNIILSYRAAKKYADEHGIKIYNATRGGELEVFERVDFDSLF